MRAVLASESDLAAARSAFAPGSAAPKGEGSDRCSDGSSPEGRDGTFGRLNAALASGFLSDENAAKKLRPS